MHINELDTPALLVDVDQLARNIAMMQQQISELGLNLRPHCKAHKTPELALQQIAAGAKGVCVAKLGEAEVLARGGVQDILITTPIAGLKKVQRLIALQRQYPTTRLIQVVDHIEQIQLIGKEAQQQQVSIPLLIEVESGQQRCGVEVGDELLNLIRAIQACNGVSYLGVQAYSGHLQQVKTLNERNHAAREAVLPLFTYIEQVLTPLGLAPSVVSGGGTGTFAAYQGLGFTEIQAGSYVFMDASYRSIEDLQQASEPLFGCALSVLATVISTPKPHRAVVDAGMKSLSIDLGMAQVLDDDSIRYQCGGDEHGILHLSQQSQKLRIGDKILLLPSHCDTTVNNFDTFVLVSGTEVVGEVAIAARGRCD
ncbi:DSD1 family PLP-dependent enzyme [Pseudoalteromonas fenneropenaei]|uniref:DSD1 family PLP-dependent enzyme n=1 Tax=Pseudoalteromonas fenneropenaei TaxID=1737459 RepID=A0ABV7CJI9_9GAMM